MGLFDKLGGGGGGGGGGLGDILGGGSSGDLFGDDFTWWDPLDLRGAGGRQAALDAAAIQSASAKRGLKELRRQFNISQGNIEPFMEAGQSALPFLTQGSSVEGMDQIFNQIMGTDLFGELRDERTRDISGMLGAGGLRRSGDAIEQGASIAPDLASEIYGLISGTAGDVATMGANTSVGAGSHSAEFGRGASGLIGNMGSAGAMGILGGQQAVAQGQQNAMGLAAIMMKAFSDPSLKQNIEQVGKIGPLNLYQWEWKPEFEDTVVAQCPTIGFISTEVKEHYPEYVGEFGGFDTINYPALIEELECH